MYVFITASNSLYRSSMDYNVQKEAVSGSFCGVTQNTCSTGTIRVPSTQKWMKRSIISISIRKAGVGNSNILTFKSRKNGMA